MLEELLALDPNFQTLIDKYNIIEKDYQEAVAKFDSLDFESCRSFFSEHIAYKNSAQYLSLCEGVAYWCGTWKDESGNIFTINVDHSMKIDYQDFSSSAGHFYYPWQVYVRIYDNNRDVTEYLMKHGKHYVIRENNFEHFDGTIDVGFELIGEQSFQTYHFVEGNSIKDSCSILKYDADIGNAKRVWQRYYYKVVE